MKMMPCVKLMLCMGAAVCLLLASACGNAVESSVDHQPVSIKGLSLAERVDLMYADQFAIDRYDGGYALISVADGGRYLVIPEGKEAPDGLAKDIKIIERPADHIYLAATAAMSFFDALGCGGNIQFSGTKAEDWCIDYAKEAMERGDMLYAGKYREPDYELLLDQGCRLSVQSTMIEHNPEVKEKLIELGIPVFVDYSSYESHPLGRCEWIKVYGELTDQADTAQRLFLEQTEKLKAIEKQKTDTGKTVAFFYISNSGQAVTRKPGDYVSKMMGLAGGNNIFQDIDSDSATSTMMMEMEQFYTTAKDADIIIYNNDIGKDVHSIEDLIAKNQLLADFKAVKNGNVWCTKENLFQETMKIGEIIADFNAVFSGTAEENPPTFMFPLEREAAA